MERGFFHPDRGYWQVTDVRTEPFVIVVEPERIEVDDEGNETIIPAVTRETTPIAELLTSYPDGTVEVPIKPGADYEWQDDAWVHVPPPPSVPDRVTARQFKLQLLTAGLIDDVEAWIATQDRAVQIAYEYSGTFVRDEPMMQAGFTALGFTSQEVDEFFTAAAAI